MPSSSLGCSALPRRAVRWAVLAAMVALLFAVAACDSNGETEEEEEPPSMEMNCTIPAEYFEEGANRGSITPVDTPSIVDTAEAQRTLSSFTDFDRVIGLSPSLHQTYNNLPLAIPLDVLFQDEVMNLDGWASRPLAITYCPLTTSTLVFDREAVNGARFDVSGLLLNNDNEEHPGNLVMVDEQNEESLWPQMSRGAVCGPLQGTALNTLPAIEMQWGRWKELHPNTQVAIKPDPSGSPARAHADHAHADHGSSARMVGRPAGGATAVDEIPRGRVLGIPNRDRLGGGTGGLALAFQDLGANGVLARAVEVTVSRVDMVVFWDTEAQAAMAFETSASFSVQNGRIVDDQTRSVWAVDGRAVEGARQGEQLDPVETAYIARGSAWFDFQPDSRLWSDSQ